MDEVTLIPRAVCSALNSQAAGAGSAVDDPGGGVDDPCGGNTDNLGAFGYLTISASRCSPSWFDASLLCFFASEA